MTLRQKLELDGIDKTIACIVVENIVRSTANMAFFLGGKNAIDYLSMKNMTRSEIQLFIRENAEKCVETCVHMIMDEDCENERYTI